MTWFGLLSRGRGHPIQPPAARPGAPAPAGIDYLRAQAGLAQPSGSWPIALALEPSGLDVGLSREAVSLDTLRGRAEQAQERSDWDEAEALWRTMRTEFPHVWDCYTGAATALSKLGRLDEAEHLLSEAAVRFPQERAIPIAHGRLAMGRSDWRAAENHWRAALKFDVRPWWVYTKLADALEHQGRLSEAESVVQDGQIHAEDPNEITLFTHPARLAWKRKDWPAALARWVEARRRFPHAQELPAKQYEALMRLAEHDAVAYEAAVRDLELEFPGEDKRVLMLRFESLGGTGPDGGCEFGCVQRQHGVEPLGLFRWASVSPTSLIACLNGRFAGIGDAAAITISPHECQWEISDTTYGTKMHSFVSPDEVSHERMIVLASKRMRYLREKLIADLEMPEKTFVLKVGWEHVTAAETEALSQAIRSYGAGELLCVCAATSAHPEGTIVPAAPAVFVGYIDFSGRSDVVQRRSAWEMLCRAMSGMAAMPGTE
jgi:tetratricopeptide (TPR) repeat protein